LNRAFNEHLKLSEIAARITIARPASNVLTSKYNINAHSVSPAYSAKNCGRCSRSLREASPAINTGIADSN